LQGKGGADAGGRTRENDFSAGEVECHARALTGFAEFASDVVE
jgi:hypothetical protein